MTRKRFERLVAKAVRGIPKRFLHEMDNVAVEFVDHPFGEGVGVFVA